MSKETVLEIQEENMNMSREAHAVVQAINEMTAVLKEIRDLIKPPDGDDEEITDPDDHIL